MSSEPLLDLLRAWWRAAPPEVATRTFREVRSPLEHLRSFGAPHGCRGSPSKVRIKT